MRAVSIQDFIDEVFQYDSSPPAVFTIRRHCDEKYEFGRPMIPGAFKLGKIWKIDLDCYYREMDRSISGCEGGLGNPEEEAFVDNLARELATPG
jgi:hypothetical protein